MANSDTVVSKSDIIDYFINDVVSWVTFKRYGSKFIVILQATDLLGTVFLGQYRRMVRRELAEEVEEFTVCEWMMAPCVNHIVRLAPQRTQDARCTLQEYIFPTTYRLEIMGASRLMVYCAEYGHTTPALGVMPSVYAPPFTGVPRYVASSILVAEDMSSGSWHSEQKQVRLGGAEGYFTLRQIGSQRGFVREACTLHAVAKLPNSLRTPKMVGVVTSDDGKVMVGILVTHIRTRGSLHSREMQRMRQHREIWKKQVMETLQVLHGYGITWGFVSAENVVIDEQMEAWVTDFSGTYDREHLATTLYSTPEGEMQEIEKIFDALDSRDGVTSGALDSSEG